MYIYAHSSAAHSAALPTIYVHVNIHIYTYLHVYIYTHIHMFTCT